MGILLRKILRTFESATGESVDYLREVARASPLALWKFVFFTPLSAHRTRGGMTTLDPVEDALLTSAWHAARLVATRSEDCGPCVRIVLRMARRDDVAPELLRAVFEGRHADLPGGADGDLALVCRYAEAVAANTPDASELADIVAARLGEKARVDLALAVATARVYPTLKRGLGHARSCELVDIDEILGGPDEERSTPC